MQQEDSGNTLGKRCLESPSCNKPVKISCCRRITESRKPIMTVICTGEKKLQLGQPWKFEINVNVIDSVSHVDLLEKESDISISGDGLCLEKCTKKTAPGGIVIRGVTCNEGPPGPKNLYVHWKDLTRCLTFELLTDGLDNSSEKLVSQECDDDATKHSQTEDIEPHVCNKITNCPFSLSFLHYAENKVVNITRNHHLKYPLIMQLMGHGGLPLQESNVRIELCLSEDLQIYPDLTGTMSNQNGLGIFGKLRIFSQRIVESCPVKICSNGCYGMFTIFAKAYYLDHIITSPKLHLHIEFNSSKPKQLKIYCNNIVDYTAGSDLEEYKVFLVAEDNGIIANAIAQHFAMKFLPSGKTVFQNKSYTALPYVDKSQKGFFFFRNRRAPTKCGQYGIQFVYTCLNCSISSEVLQINVLPNKPTKLTSPCPIPTPAVSNSKNICDRIIVEQLKLELRDMHDNLAVTTVNAQLSIDLKSQDNSSITPVFDGGVKKMIVPLVDAEVLLPSVSLEENCPGVDGHEYILNFEVISEDLPHEEVLKFEIPFYFYHGMNKLEIAEKLRTEYGTLQPSSKAYRELFDITQDLLKALQDNVKRLVVEELTSRTELKKFGLFDHSLSSLPNISYTLQQRLAKRAEIWKIHRKCDPSPLITDPLVVGKVVHLACVADEGIARILSWHLAEKMQCMVTRTTEKAIEIHRNTSGTQQVLSIDLSNRDDALNVWKRPLPHTEVPGNFKPTGNPVAARDQLILSSRHFHTCKVVFGILLGDTVLIDTMEDGVLYRREIVKHGSCPAILTRNGHRIRSDGSFSGLENSCGTSVNQSNGLVFYAPLPNEEKHLVEVIGLLLKHNSIMQQLVAANEELERYQQHNGSSDMSAKLEECDKMEMRLKKIESQLESLSGHSALLSEDVISNCILVTTLSIETVNSTIKSESVTEITEHSAANEGEFEANCNSVLPD